MKPEPKPQPDGERPDVANRKHRSIYEFAYATGEKVIAPRRHQRHALDFTKTGTNLLSQIAANHNFNGRWNTFRRHRDE